MSKIKKEIKLLQKCLTYHNYLYFYLDKPIISDYEYDLLFNRLKFLEKKYKEKNINSPTQVVGSKVLNFHVLNKHLTPMLSLENVFQKNEFIKFCEKIFQYQENDQLINFFCELKYDGIAVNLIYKNGVLKKASTRGDGWKGEDITKNIFLIKSIPLKINEKNLPKLIEIRGEVLMLKKDFSYLNEKSSFLKKNKFSNARNLASGSLRQKTMKNFKSRKLVFICHGFEIFNFFKSDSYYKNLLQIKKWGFNISEEFFFSSSIKKILNFYLRIKNKRFFLDFDIDGVVVKVDNLNLRKKIGYRSRSPRWAIAYKFPNKEKTTILKNVTFHIGRTGIITPVAHFNPVNISGTILEKASLYNKNFLKKLKIYIGDEIIVCRAGEVIPKIIKKSYSNVQKRKLIQIKFPKKCPSCQSRLKISKDNKKIFCKNYFSCSEQIKKRLIHFFSKTSFEIKDLGPNIINQLVDKKRFISPIDFFKLDVKTLNNLKNVGKKISERIIYSLKNFKSIDLNNFIFSLGIKGIGRIASEKIAKNFKSLDEVLNITEKSLFEINGVGRVIAKNFFSFITNENNKKIIYELINKYKICVLNYKNKNLSNLESNFFINKKVLLTGTLKSFSRKKAHNILENLGADLRNHISKNLDLVIMGKNPGKKLIYAKNFGIKIINEHEFLKKI
jgi:DNA ligase (NAD+)